MTKLEMAKAFTILQLNYPDSFTNKDDGEILSIINLWADIFAEDDYEQVLAAIKAHIATDTSRWMPPIGVIKNALKRFTQNTDTEGEAWAAVHKAISNSAYHAGEEFDKLSPTLKRIVGSPLQLREWGQMPPDELNIIQSNVMRSYRAIAAKERELSAIPASVRNVLMAGEERKELTDGKVSVVADKK